MTIAEKITQLGGHLADPATDEEIEATEKRLRLILPTKLREFLLQNNGTIRESDQAMWSFWPCSEIIPYSQYDKTEESFYPLQLENEALVKLRGDRLILFADAMLHAPVYAVYLSPEDPYHEAVFELITNTLSAKSFGEWIDLFLNRGEEGVF
jgi:hypothetical protein